MLRFAESVDATSRRNREIVDLYGENGGDDDDPQSSKGKAVQLDSDPVEVFFVFEIPTPKSNTVLGWVTSWEVLPAQWYSTRETWNLILQDPGVLVRGCDQKRATGESRCISCSATLGRSGRWPSVELKLPNEVTYGVLELVGQLIRGPLDTS
ncbi:hypothetical protein Sjap_020872 [Stephania japonica]|uniref:Uncharacterized protein n=1 Tax=Stephania japonica TaxID=461633 RepID=A0AAP0HVY7_9MAGN